MPRISVTLIGLAVGIALSMPSGRVHAQLPRAGRIVAVGDIHGSLEGLRTILRATGLIDAANHWSGGAATLAQTGDMLDRGADVRGVMDLLMALEREASKAKGRVAIALGNHEIMNLIGAIRDVTPEICASFADAKSDRTRARAWADYEKLAVARARSRPSEVPSAFPRTKEAWHDAYVRGCVEYRQAMGSRGVYGKWLRKHPIAVEAGGTVFMHAGPNPLAAPPSMKSMNEQAARELERFDRFLRRLVGARLARPWFRLDDVLSVAAAEVSWVSGKVAAAEASGNAPDFRGIDLELVREAAEILQISTWSLLAPDGPLWYRGYATADEATLSAPLAALLDQWGAKRIVVGHTPNRDYKIHARIGGRVVLIDTGMLASFYEGVASALEIVGDDVTAIYADGTRAAVVSSP